MDSPADRSATVFAARQYRRNKFGSPWLAHLHVQNLRGAHPYRPAALNECQSQEAVQGISKPDLWAPLVMEIADGSTIFLWSEQRSHHNRGTFLGSL